MNPSYDDITSRAGTPRWWGPAGVPRYAEFHPDHCGTQATHVAKLRVICQHCGREFVVASQYDLARALVKLPNNSAETRDPWSAIGSFHYGEPPRHGCIGDLMTTLPIEVLEFWERTLSEFVWNRHGQFEITLPTLGREVNPWPTEAA